MSTNFERYQKAMGNPIVMEDADSKQATIEFFANVKEGGTNWNKFASQGKLRNAGKKHEEVELIIPFVIKSKGTVQIRDSIHWNDAMAGRKTAQLAFLEMLNRHFITIARSCDAATLRAPDSTLFLTIVVSSNDTAGYNHDVVKHLSALLRKLNNNQKIDNHSYEGIRFGKNEFDQQYKELARLYHKLEKGTNIVLKFEARTIS